MIGTSLSRSLDALPPEILDQVLDDLELKPQDHHDNYLRKQPYLELSQERARAPSDLKSLSLVSSILRRAVIGRLFRHLQLIVSPPLSDTKTSYSRDVLFQWTFKISKIAKFIQQHCLGRSVRSFIVKVIDGQGYYNIDEHEESQRNDTEDLLIRRHWHSLLLVAPNLQRLTIIAPPFCIGILVSIKLSPYISEALHMPYQIVSMQRSLKTGSITKTTTSQDTHNMPSILCALDWTALLLNEGSFLRCYADTSGGWVRKLLSTPEGETEPQQTPKFPEEFWRKLESFEYVAISPIVEVVQHLASWLQIIPGLKTFTFQTQPMSDLLPDSSQRGIAPFIWLQDEKCSVYRAITSQLMRPPYMHQGMVKGTRIQKLVRILCRDSDDSSGSYRDWLAVLSTNPPHGWMSFKLENGEFGCHRILGKS